MNKNFAVANVITRNRSAAIAAFVAGLLFLVSATNAGAQQRSLTVSFPVGSPPVKVHVVGPGVDTIVPSGPDWTFSALHLRDQISLTLLPDDQVGASTALIGFYGDGITAVDQPATAVTIVSDTTVIPRVASRDPSVATQRTVVLPAGSRMLATPFQSTNATYPSDHALIVGHYVLPGGGRFHPNYYAGSSLRIWQTGGLPANPLSVALRLFYAGGTKYTVTASEILQEGGLTAGSDPTSFGGGPNWSHIPTQTTQVSSAGVGGDGWVELPIQWPGSYMGLFLATSDTHDGSSDWQWMVLDGPLTSDTAHQPALKISWDEPTAPATAPVIGAVSGNIALTVGQSTVLSVGVSGYPAPALSWSKDGSTISGATTARLALSDVKAGDAGSYSITASNSAGTVSQVVSVVSISPAPPAPTAPVVTDLPSGITVTDGDRLNLTPTVTGTAPVVISWAKDGSAIAGATATIFTVASVSPSAAGTYTISATNAEGTTSGSTVITVNPRAPKITSDPTSASVDVGSAASFTVAASGTAPLKYQWKKNGLMITGATAASLAIASTAAADDADYACVVTNGGGSAESGSAHLTVLPDIKAPQITAAPSSITVAAGGTASFDVTATGTPPLHFQWWVNSLPVTGATDSTYSIGDVTAADDGAEVRVDVSNSKDHVFSDSAVLKVVAPSTGSNSGSSTSSPSPSPTSSTGTSTGSGSTSGGNTSDGSTSGPGAPQNTGTTSPTPPASSGASSSSTASGGSTNAGDSPATGTPTIVVAQPVFASPGNMMTVTGSVSLGTAPAAGAHLWVKFGGQSFPGVSDLAGKFAISVSVPDSTELGASSLTVVWGSASSSASVAIVPANATVRPGIDFGDVSVIELGQTSPAAHRALATTTNPIREGVAYFAKDISDRVTNDPALQASSAASTVCNMTGMELTPPCVEFDTMVIENTINDTGLAVIATAMAEAGMSQEDIAVWTERLNLIQEIRGFGEGGVSAGKAFLDHPGETVQKIFDAFNVGQVGADQAYEIAGLVVHRKDPKVGGFVVFERSTGNLYFLNYAPWRTWTDLSWRSNVSSTATAVGGFVLRPPGGAVVVRELSNALIDAQVPNVLTQTRFTLHPYNQPALLVDEVFAGDQSLLSPWQLIGFGSIGAGESAYVGSVLAGHPTTISVDALVQEPRATMIQIGFGQGVVASNLSARFVVTPGSPVIVGGMTAGIGSMRVLVRAVGGSLGQFVPDPSQVSQLVVYENQVEIARATTVSPAAALAASTVGAFPLTASSGDAAVVLTCTAPRYDFHVYGTAGEAMVEIYRLQ